MDAGIFKASKTRLVMWIIVPPVLIVAVGLSSFAFNQQAHWSLKKTEGLASILPTITASRVEVQTLYDNMGISEGKRLESGDQFIALLKEKARGRSVSLNRTQVLGQEKSGHSSISVVSALVEMTGDFKSFQLFLNDVKLAYPLISARSVELNQPREAGEDNEFELKVVFDLMLVGDLLKSHGGIQ